MIARSKHIGSVYVTTAKNLRCKSNRFWTDQPQKLYGFSVFLVCPGDSSMWDMPLTTVPLSPQQQVIAHYATDRTCDCPPNVNVIYTYISAGSVSLGVSLDRRSTELEYFGSWISTQGIISWFLFHRTSLTIWDCTSLTPKLRSMTSLQTATKYTLPLETRTTPFWTGSSYQSPRPPGVLSHLVTNSETCSSNYFNMFVNCDRSKFTLEDNNCFFRMVWSPHDIE